MCAICGCSGEHAARPRPCACAGSHASARPCASARPRACGHRPRTTRCACPPASSNSKPASSPRTTRWRRGTAAGSPEGRSWRSTSSARRGPARRRCSNARSPISPASRRSSSSRAIRPPPTTRERIRAAGAPVVQLNTGTGCHLDAAMVARALGELRPPPGAAVMIENVGNLVCPALFDLGERAKIVLFSVTEGEDKPVKYPHMFAAASLVLIAKIDLLPYVEFDLGRALASLRAVNPNVAALPRLGAHRRGHGSVVRLAAPAGGRGPGNRIDLTNAPPRRQHAAAVTTVILRPNGSCPARCPARCSASRCGWRNRSW